MNRKLYENLIQYILDHQERFYRLAYSYTGNQEDALDVVQNAVCKALEAYGSIRNPNAIHTWFHRILTNECLRLLKARQKDGRDFCAEELYEPTWKKRTRCTTRKPTTGRMWRRSWTGWNRRFRPSSVCGFLKRCP